MSVLLLHLPPEESGRILDQLLFDFAHSGLVIRFHQNDGTDHVPLADNGADGLVVNVFHVVADPNEVAVSHGGNHTFPVINFFFQILADGFSEKVLHTA